MSNGGFEEMRESIRSAGKKAPISAHQSMMHVEESLHKISEHVISLTNEYERKLNVAHRDIEEFKRQLAEYRGQGGTINMERSWKTKYRRALAEANQRLIENELDPVRIRKAETEACSGDCDE